jgi:hypothetical protein
MAPIRYSSPDRNQNENNSSQNLHNTIFRRIHWTNEPNHMNWETYHRLQNQLQQLALEILIWEIEITIRPTTPEQTTHWRHLKRLYKGTKEMMNVLLTNSNQCPYCNNQESEQDSSEDNEQ